MTWGGPQTDWVAYKFWCARWFLRFHPFEGVWRDGLRGPHTTGLIT